jgi:subtilisin family serine protease
VTPKRTLNLTLSLAVALSLLPMLAVAGPPVQPQAPSKIEQTLLDQFITGDTAGYLVYFEEEADLSQAYGMNWHDRGWFVTEALQDTARRSQARVRAYLDAQGVTYQAFWIDNVIAVDSTTPAVLHALAERAEVEIIRAHRIMHLIEPVDRVEAAASPTGIEPNISHVGAPDVWALGYRGEGIVVSNIDTGVRYTHNALVDHYRGNLGDGSFSHDYNWLDPDTGHATPSDDHGHGSHTMGTMIGDDGGANRIGMAPDAKWIACDACNTSGGCPDAALLTCAQWIAAPYPIGHPESPNPDKRPHVANNSWGDCGQSYDGWYQGAVDGWLAAGIYPIFSNGNASNCSYSYPPGCGTVGNPARYGNVTGVGSTGQMDGQYADHSNWGGTDVADTVNPRGFSYLKPQVLAPGKTIRSSIKWTDSYYASWTGTSMSAPHVSGLIALMWQAAPCLVGDYATTETILEQTASPIPFASACGGEGVGDVPNQATGWGEIDALAAVQAARDHCQALLPPEASFAWTPFTIYADTLVQFRDTSSGLVVEWLWQLDDGAAYAFQNPSHTFPSTGTFAVSLTVTTSLGYADTASRTITVHEQGYEPPRIYLPLINKNSQASP